MIPMVSTVYRITLAISFLAAETTESWARSSQRCLCKQRRRLCCVWHAALCSHVEVVPL